MRESKQVGIIYHFTDIYAIKKLMNKNLMSEYGCDILTFSSRNGHLSTSRDYDLTRDPFGEFPSSKYNIRIAIDGDKLSNKFKINPINGLKDNNKEIFGTDKNFMRVNHKSEKEEVVCPLKFDKYFRMKDYVVEIQVLQHNYIESEEIFKELEDIVKKMKLKISINIVRKFKPFGINEHSPVYDKIIGYKIMNDSFREPKLNEAGAGDFIMAYKIMKDLSKPWKDFDAYSSGLIDSSGKRIRYAESDEEKRTVTSYEKIIINLKRLMSKVVKNNFAQKILTTMLLRESDTNGVISENTVSVIMSKYDFKDFEEMNEMTGKMYIDSYIESVIEF